MLCRVAHGTNLHIGRARRDTDDHFERRREERASGLDFANHATQHHLGSIEVGNHATLQWANGAEVGVGTADVWLRSTSQRLQLSGLNIHRHHRWLIYHNFIVVNNQRIGRSEVNRQLLCQRKNTHKNILFFIFCSLFGISHAKVGKVI